MTDTKIECTCNPTHSMEKGKEVFSNCTCNFSDPSQKKFTKLGKIKKVKIKSRS